MITDGFTALTSFLALATIAVMVAVAGCGVRGRPQAPLTPAQLGRGQPTFKRATEEFAFPNVPSPETSATPENKSPNETD